MPMTYEDGELRTKPSKSTAKMDKIAREVKKIQLVLRSKGILVPKPPEAEQKKTVNHGITMHGRNPDGTKKEQHVSEPEPEVPDTVTAMLDHTLRPGEIQGAECFPTSITESPEEPLFFKPTPKFVPVYYDMIQERRIREMNDKFSREAVEPYLNAQHRRGTLVTPLSLGSTATAYRFGNSAASELPPGSPITTRYPTLPSIMQSAIPSRDGTPGVNTQEYETHRSSDGTAQKSFSWARSPAVRGEDFERCTSTSSSLKSTPRESPNHARSLMASQSTPNGTSRPPNSTLSHTYTIGTQDLEPGELHRLTTSALRSRSHYKDNGTRLSHMFPLSQPGSRK